MFFEVVQPSGEAKITGTLTTIRNDRAMKQKRASWKNRSILIMKIKILKEKNLVQCKNHRIE
jgi:hypothetical protein